MRRLGPVATSPAAFLAFAFAAGLARAFGAAAREGLALREPLPDELPPDEPLSDEPLSALFASAGFASDFESAAFVSAAEPLFAGLESDDVSGSLSTARLRLFSLSPLKSGSYQPPPYRRNTGADTSFFIAFLPHEGHFFSGASVTFCSSSV